MTSYVIVENPGREQAFTIWRGYRTWRGGEVYYFAFTRAEAEEWIAVQADLAQRSWRVRIGGA